MKHLSSTYIERNKFKTGIKELHNQLFQISRLADMAYSVTASIYSILRFFIDYNASCETKSKALFVFYVDKVYHIKVYGFIKKL